ncbi:MAG TPA: hypothetical protein VI278_06060 [Nitrososphaeraceae archaeon]
MTRDPNGKMTIKSTSPVSTADILDSISDDISLELFKIIAGANNNNTNNSNIAATKKSSSSLFDAKNKITRKQYYSRMNKLVKHGLAKRYNARYFLTSLGRVIYYNLRIIENACQIQWKLKAIDSLESSRIPAEATTNIIESLIQDNTVREILLSNEPEKHDKQYKIQEQQHTITTQSPPYIYPSHIK